MGYVGPESAMCLAPISGEETRRILRWSPGDCGRRRRHFSVRRTLSFSTFLCMCSISLATNISGLSLGFSKQSSSRRKFLGWSSQQTLIASVGIETAAKILSNPSWAVDLDAISADQIKHPFIYTEDWTGTKLPLLTLEQAVLHENLRPSPDSATTLTWPMARWPDPILRRPASEVDPYWFGSSTLKSVCQILQDTAQSEGAVGLAAQQCGLDARIVYVGSPCNLVRSRDTPIVMVNPHIVNRSPETQTRVWDEHCLVLPPTFVATVLRDDWVDVLYWTWQGGKPRQIRLQGEASRCVQHELDHDRGILVTDHVSLEELESDTMRAVERVGHDRRMALAYSRLLDDRDSLVLFG